MQVSENEGRLFYDLFVGLQMLVNRRYGVIPTVDSSEELMALPPEQRIKTRDALYEHPECFDEFLREGDLSASADAAEIVAGWRDHRVSGMFYIFRHLKSHTIFLLSEEPARAFGVLGLADPLEKLAPHPPVMITATLLPFRGRIIYDGFLTTMGPMILFGGGMRRMFNDTYRDAKARFGVITSLPHVVDQDLGVQDDVADHRRLKTLVKSERSRELHWDEILELRERSPKLDRVYHQERGKADARWVGRRLRERGVTQGWFALYEGMVIASATTQKALARRVREILPASTGHLPYLYQLKKKP
jgi:hypothetical protein